MALPGSFEFDFEEFFFDEEDNERKLQECLRWEAMEKKRKLETKQLAKGSHKSADSNISPNKKSVKQAWVHKMDKKKEAKIKRWVKKGIQRTITEFMKPNDRIDYNDETIFNCRKKRRYT